jgi:glycosyltransferase involved in cell wall biosynthesis
MPKILRIVNRFNLGGPSYNAAYLTKFLEPEFETLLVAGMKDETEESSEFITKDLGLQPIYIPEMYRNLHPIRDLKSYFEIKRIIKVFKPDIVHTHAAKAGAIGRLAAWDSKVPIIVHTFHGHVFHSYFNKAKTRMFLQIERYLANRTSKIIALSTAQKYELCNIYKVATPDKVDIVPLGFDLKRFEVDQESKRKKFRAKYNLDDDEIAIGIIGRLVPIKNHAMFLKIIKLVSETTSKKIRAYIIGDGEEREKIEEVAIALSLNFNNDNIREKNIITFTSWIKEIDVCNAGLDIIVLTSNNEGTPVSLIEAQAAGKPIVTTDVGGITDILTHNDITLSTKKGDENKFAKNILHLLDIQNEWDKSSLSGRKFMNANFSYQKLCSNTASLYRTLLHE